jgi:hypothetical protein
MCQGCLVACDELGGKNHQIAGDVGGKQAA